MELIEKAQEARFLSTKEKRTEFAFDRKAKRAQKYRQTNDL
ncbi:MAG: hypothetical protein QW097_00265 [archaeon]